MRKIIVITLLACIQINAGYSQGPTRWRGPNSAGVYPEKGILKQWPENGPELVWHYDELGQGHSSPAFANGKIYVSGMVDNAGYIFVLSLEGKLITKYKYGNEFYDSYPGSRSTPTIVGDLLYILSGTGDLVCLNESTGAVKWKKNIFTDFDGKNLTWGITESLWIDGDVLYCAPGGSKYNVISLNRFTGNLIWSAAGKGELSAYCSPLLIELPGRKLLVTMMASHILGIDANTGKTLWSHYQPNRWSVHANTPVYNNGSIYCVSGYGQGSVNLKLNNDGSQVTQKWFNEKLDNRIGGVVLVNGYIYGSGDNNRAWFCLDWETGKIIYSSNAIEKGTVIAADGMLICYSERGELALVEANAKEFTIKGKTQVTRGSAQHWAHPVIDKGKLYVRHGNALMAYKIKI